MGRRCLAFIDPAGTVIISFCLSRRISERREILIIENHAFFHPCPADRATLNASGVLMPGVRQPARLFLPFASVTEIVARWPTGQDKKRNGKRHVKCFP
jgi:hypothetical protein